MSWMVSLFVPVSSHKREEEVDFGGDHMGEWSSGDSGEESEETETYPAVKVTTFGLALKIGCFYTMCFPCRARRWCTRAMPLQGRALVCSPPTLATRKRKRRRRKRKKKEHLLQNPLSL